MNGNKLDEIDLRILRELQRDGRMEIQALATRVNLTRTPVAQRVKRLMDNGVIRRFVALVDRIKVGRPVLIIVHVKLEKQTADLLNEFENRVIALPEVQCCLHVSGDWNFILHISTVTPQDHYDFLMHHINGVPNVAHTASSFVLKECKRFDPLPL